MENNAILADICFAVSLRFTHLWIPAFGLKVQNIGTRADFHTTDLGSLFGPDQDQGAAVLSKSQFAGAFTPEDLVQTKRGSPDQTVQLWKLPQTKKEKSRLQWVWGPAVGMITTEAKHCFTWCCRFRMLLNFLLIIYQAFIIKLNLFFNTKISKCNQSLVFLHLKVIKHMLDLTARLTQSNNMMLTEEENRHYLAKPEACVLLHKLGHEALERLKLATWEQRTDNTIIYKIWTRPLRCSIQCGSYTN